MDRIGRWTRRIWHLLNRRRFEAALQREMEAHRAELGDAARFGNTLRLREEARDVWGWNWLDDLGGDLRLGVRALRRSPIFTATCVLVLSLGIGVNLTFFQVAYGALLQPPRVKDPGTLVRFDRRGPHFTSTAVAYPIANFVAGRRGVLSAVLTRYRTTLAWTDRGEQRVPAAFVSPNWFTELGATAARGRLIGDVDRLPADTPAAVVSYDFWLRALSGRPDVVGSTLRLNDNPVIIVGVAAEDFTDVRLDDLAIWMSVAQIATVVPGSRVGTDWNSEGDMYGRLRPGVSVESAKASLRATLQELARLEPSHIAADEWLEPYLGTAQFRSPRNAQEVRSVLTALTLLVAIVLMIACFNLSHLTLTRALGRAHEMGIRAGLGAGRWRIVRLLLAECGLVAAAGALGGLLFGQAAIRLLTRWIPPLSRVDFTPDWRTAVAMFACALVAMLAIGLSPAWKIGRADLAAAARDGGERLSQGLQSVRLKQILIAGQIAGSCLLLVFTAQIGQTLARANAHDLGFEFEHVAVVEPSLGAYGVSPAAAQRYWQELRRAADALPQTAGTTMAGYAPLSGQSNTSQYGSLPNLRITVMAVAPSFFEVMRIPLLAGRTFEPQDTRETSIIVSRRVALEMFGTVDVVGRRYPTDDPKWTIVGVVGDAHLINPQATNMAEHYRPLGPDVVDAALIVRAEGSPAALLAPLRQAARAADARVVPEMRLMQDDFERTVQGPAIAGSLAGGVAMLALLLACLGLFGVVSQSARLRTKEIGIRLAIGARRGAIVRLLLRQSTWACAIGVTIGCAAAAAVTMTLTGPPLYLDGRDPAAYLMAVAVLASTGTAAAIVPAVRSLRADPLKALRQE